MEQSTPSEAPKDLDFLRPAITGGFLLGVLSAIPFINAANCLCCLWIQGGGGLAAWLVNKQRPGTLKYGDGAFAGILAGLIGTLVHTVVEIPFQAILMTPQAAADMLKTLNTLFPEAPPEVQQQMAFLFEPGFNLSRTLVSVISFSIIGGLFSMIGGILTVATINQQKKNGPSPGASTTGEGPQS